MSESRQRAAAGLGAAGSIILTLAMVAGTILTAAMPLQAAPMLAAGTVVPSTQHGAATTSPEYVAEPAAHGLPQHAVEIGRPFGFPITNSMVVTWIATLGLIVLARAATRRMSEVPGPTQNFMEWLVESLYGFLESIIGGHLVQKTF
jgi:hypothetical protein